MDHYFILFWLKNPSKNTIIILYKGNIGITILILVCEVLQQVVGNEDASPAPGDQEPSRTQRLYISCIPSAREVDVLPGGEPSCCQTSKGYFGLRV